jgi:hypothetical protein
LGLLEVEPGIILGRQGWKDDLKDRAVGLVEPRRVGRTALRRVRVIDASGVDRYQFGAEESRRDAMIEAGIGILINEEVRGVGANPLAQKIIRRRQVLRPHRNRRQQQGRHRHEQASEQPGHRSHAAEHANPRHANRLPEIICHSHWIEMRRPKHFFTTLHCGPQRAEDIRHGFEASERI